MKKVAMRYYLDTSIWMDFFGDRIGYKGEPLGQYARRFLSILLSKGEKIVLSDLIIIELSHYYSADKMRVLFAPLEGIIDKIYTTSSQKERAKLLSKIRKVPTGDALHAVIAHDLKLFLITRDKHFRKLRDISESHKPEHLI